MCKLRFGVINLCTEHKFRRSMPLFDAAFVVFMRWREGRPVYLGDNRHLSHRLTRCGFSRTESVLILWGVALILGGVGALSIHGGNLSRYMAFLISAGFMLIITVLIVKKEKESMKILETKDDSESATHHGSSRIRADVPN